MVHIPEIESINAICPNCGVRFGYVVNDNAVTCPMCKFVQPLPIILIGKDLYYCIPCGAKRYAQDVASAKCVNCGGSAGWRFPESGPPASVSASAKT